MVEMAARPVGHRGSKIAENTVSLAVSGAAGVVFSVIQLSVLSRSLTGEYFGLFVALRGFSLFLSTVILAGLPQVLIRYLPSYQSRGERWRALVLFIVSSFVVFALGFVLYLSSGWWEGRMPGGISSLIQSDDVIYWMLLASMTLAVKLLLYGGFSGLREMRMQMFLEPLYLGALTVYIVVYRSGLTIPRLFQAVCVLNGIVFCVGLPIFVHLLRRLIDDVGSGRSDLVALPSFFPYWGGAVTLSFVALAFTDVDRFVMSSVLPVSMISLFHVASRINGLLKRFLGMPVVAAQPEITRIYEEGRWNDLTGRIGLFTKGILVVSIFTAGLAAVIGKDVITVLSGQNYRDAYGIFLLLLVTVPLSAIAAPLVITMRSLHFMHWAVLCDFVWMAAYFGTFFVFISFWGVIGMAVAQVFATVVQIIVAISLARREGFYGGFGERLGRVLVAVAVTVPVGIVITGRLGIVSSIACLVLFPLACKLAVKLFGVFDDSEKRQINEFVPVRLGRRVVGWLLSVEA